MSEKSTLNGMILSYPTLVELGTTTAEADAPAQSWVQLAVAGAFESNRYGTFAITPDDLRMMAANFRPGVTPIDYDHLSMEATKPFDGIAAGWLQGIELRDGGTTLWGLVEWTPDATRRIENREYRFISPSFMKDYTTATGEKVGTKLLAAALTNLPFLPEMAAVTLGAEAVFGQFALSVPAYNKAQTSAQLAPASAPLPEQTTQEDRTMQNTKTTDSDIEQKAAAFAARVTALSNHHTVRAAISLATTQDAEGAEAYRLAGIGVRMADEAPALAHISLSARAGESFDALAMRYAVEKGISLREAVREVGKARPDLAAARG